MQKKSPQNVCVTAKLVGRELQTLRKERGLTQDQLGEMIGVKGSAVGQWEQGRTKPSWQNLQRLAEVLGVEHDAGVLPDLAAELREAIEQAAQRDELLGDLISAAERIDVVLRSMSDRLVRNAEILERIEAHVHALASVPPPDPGPPRRR